jgi:hypothetical protein
MPPKRVSARHRAEPAGSTYPVDACRTLPQLPSCRGYSIRRADGGPQPLYRPRLSMIGLQKNRDSRGRRYAVRRGRGWRRQLVPGDGPLARVPPLVVFLVVAAVFATGVLVGGMTGAVLLAALAVLMAALLAAAWARPAPAERALRLMVLLVLLAVAISLVD